jgi:hypothetical protein
MTCWHVIERYMKSRKKATVQSSLDKFVRKTERAAPSTSPQPSTPSTPMPAHDEPDGDVDPDDASSPPSSSTN